MSEQLKLEDEEVPIALRRAWDRTLRQLATRVNTPTFEAHIRPLQPLALMDEVDEHGKCIAVVTLGAVSAFNREWVEGRHLPLIIGLLEEAMDQDVRVKFIVTPRPLKRIPQPESGTNNGSGTGRNGAPGKGAHRSASRPETTLSPTGSGLSLSSKETETLAEPLRAEAGASGNSIGFSRGNSTGRTRTNGAFPDAPPLNTKYTFENFIAGKSNELARAGAYAVAQAPGRVYNPLFLYGPPGLGKTHLMHAIGNATGGQRVAYISGESFTSHFVTSLREHRAEEFRRKWRTVDVWLVDDVQFLAGKEHTKEEFFHTFNALYQTGKQIVISSDRSPRELLMMDERLRSRFECGLIADIAPPDLETRLAILQQKAEEGHTPVSDDVLLYMAQLVQSNIRTLEGALVRLMAYASLNGSAITTQLATKVLEQYYISPGFGDGKSDTQTTMQQNGIAAVRQNVSAEMVQRIVAQRFNLPLEALTGQKRDRSTVQARQVAMHILREITDMSLPGIGRIFGGRDHSTVAHACGRIRDQILTDDDLRKLVEELITQIRTP